MKTLLCAFAMLAAILAPVVAHGDDAFDRARSLAIEKRYSEAREVLDPLLERLPGHPRARLLHGVLRAREGRLAEAVDVFEALRRDHPDMVEPYNNLAVLYAADGRLDDAREILLATVERRPDAVIYANLADVYVKLASRALERARALDTGGGAQRALDTSVVLPATVGMGSAQTGTPDTQTAARTGTPDSKTAARTTAMVPGAAAAESPEIAPASPGSGTGSGSGTPAPIAGQTEGEPAPAAAAAPRLEAAAQSPDAAPVSADTGTDTGTGTGTGTDTTAPAVAAVGQPLEQSPEQSIEQSLDTEPRDAGEAAAGRVAAAARTASTPGAFCTHAAGFQSRRTVAEAALWLQSYGAEVFEVRHEEHRIAGSYRVYLPPFENRDVAVAKVGEIRGRGVRDVALIGDGELANGISFGVFRDADNMHRRVAELDRLGYAVRSQAEGVESVEEYVIKARAGGAPEALEAAWTARFPQRSLLFVDCV